MPCTSHMQKRVMRFAAGFPLRQSIKIPKPRIVPNRTAISVISSVVSTPSTNSFQRSSRIKVLSKLSSMPLSWLFSFTVSAAGAFSARTISTNAAG